ncbi:MAG: tetratricopeptide repeat protein [Candidatus Omnitrophota bacterium]|nr:tetratricopeptide repeat protein [Candidatus Omnitrophota bacterium]MDZ4242993.1 tetratricopeptide repeat protein [Candidatus Omnitrophota bacterium]
MPFFKKDSFNIKCLLRRSPPALLVYILVAALSLPLIDYRSLLFHAAAAVLSRLMPPFDYLVAFSEGKETINPQKLEEYERYYESVSLFMPDRPDTNGMLGYCYYYLGKHKMALLAYRAAGESLPGVFNYAYNTGLIYFRRDHHREAIEYLQKALGTTLDDNLNYVTSSRIYFPMLPESSNLANDLKFKFRDNYHNGFKLLVLSHVALQEWPQAAFSSQQAILAALEGDGFFYYHAGYALYQMKDYPQAAYFLKAYVESYPQDPNGLYYLGKSLAAIGKIEQAHILLERGRVLAEAGLSKTWDTQDIRLALY